MTEQPKNNMPEIPAGQDPGTYWWGVVEQNKELLGQVELLKAELIRANKLVSSYAQDIAALGDAALNAEHRASLTPLTDPSVRGVLVEVPQDSSVVYVDTIWNGKACNVRPASEFGVPQAEPSQKLVPLPEGVVEMVVRDTRSRSAGDVGLYWSHSKAWPDNGGGCFWADHGAGKPNWIPVKVVDPAPYGVPVERAWDQTELHKAQCESIGLRAEVERQSERIASLTSAAETAEAEAERLRKAIETHKASAPIVSDWRLRQADTVLWSALTPPTAASGEGDDMKIGKCFKCGGKLLNGHKCPPQFRPPSAPAADTEAERLRKAIETHRHKNTGMACDHKQSDLELWSALTPPTAASGEFGVCMICGADLTRSDQCLACDKCEPPKRAEPKLAVNQPRTSCQSDAAESVGDAPPVSSSAPAAESEGGDFKKWWEQIDECERVSYSYPDARMGWLACKAALSARLAACEERCRELEAGIERALVPLRELNDHDQSVTPDVFEPQEILESLLAPKADSGSQKYGG